MQQVDVEHPWCQMIDVRGADTADIGGDGRDRLEFAVPRPVDGVAGQCERRGGQVEKSRGVLRSESALTLRLRGQVQ